MRVDFYSLYARRFGQAQRVRTNLARAYGHQKNNRKQNLFSVEALAYGVDEWT